MLFDHLPENAIPLIHWNWVQISPYFRNLQERELNEQTVSVFARDWTRMDELLDETYSRLHVATTLDTSNDDAQKRFHTFLEEIFPKWSEADQNLKTKMLASGLQLDRFQIPLRRMQTHADIFREENLPLLTRERILGTEYDKIVGAQTVVWEGREIPVVQLQPVQLDNDRDRREKAWRLGSERMLADRDALGTLWKKFLALREDLAGNAGFEDYRSYRWKQLTRFDYSPDDCKSFHRAIEEAVVPAVQRILVRRAARLGLDALRPWDLRVDPLGRPALKPFMEMDELKSKASAMFHKVDPRLGSYFDLMVKERLLDLDSRKNKAPGGYCTTFAASKRPFIFMNAVGVHGDVQTLLHEAGHCFHSFESHKLPYHQQREVGMEFAEVASMAMELLASPHLGDNEGGFYSPKDAARARIEHLEDSIRFWPYMAVVDAFQHWIYENPSDAADLDACDAQWLALAERFLPGVDWSGLTNERKTIWLRQLHIHQVPFYYVEYGLAQLGAVQIWRNFREHQSDAVSAYIAALGLGGTVSLPDLYATAGARLAFDATTLAEAVDLMEKTVEELEKA
ncbi:MAG: M3 family oligoendopeptidase [Thermodesulfobacteriota bacterium]